MSLPRTFRGQAGPLLWGPRECPPRGRYPGRRSTRDKGRARPASDGTSDPDWSPMRASSRAGRVHLTNSLRGPATRGGARPHQTTARCAFPVVAGGPSPCRPLRRANTPPSTGAPSGRLRSGAVGTRLSGPRQGPPWPEPLPLPLRAFRARRAGPGSQPEGSLEPPVGLVFLQDLAPDFQRLFTDLTRIRPGAASLSPPALGKAVVRSCALSMHPGGSRRPAASSAAGEPRCFHTRQLGVTSQPCLLVAFFNLSDNS